jgi:hypothetical protein
VATGYANASYQADRFNKIYGLARILKTPAMVKRDERRSNTPAMFACLFKTLRDAMPATVRVFPGRQIKFPHVAPGSSALPARRPPSPRSSG